MQKTFPIVFPEGSSAVAFQPKAIADLEMALPQLDLHPPRPVIVVVGGAAGLRHYHVARLHTLFSKVLAPVAEALGAIVIDGGTDTGVMRMMGVARHWTKSTFPLIGVLPVGVAALPNACPPCTEAAILESNHTHFVLIPGSNWGDDSPWIAKIASLLSRGLPSITILINGGEITWQDAHESVKAQRSIVAIAGSGRAADALTAALDGNRSDERATQIVESGLLQSVNLEHQDKLREVMQQILMQKVETVRSRE
ncbi:hypothetical protein K9N68_07750 [Kovacikia minuta CCNUW1]|uniref:hypothetical protein n=1 Tax=Kovacikia minuta TaxID=2931930 RepID=UPI001CCB16A9|nr:hypothetical protein [Kovacikia minuta]UBF27796.1 hypothetical protein K9N68_07750 [Kovacikia minuta CCNUW1]